jgi:hypothetical protein
VCSPTPGNLNATRYSFQQSVSNHNHFPTVRVDYNLSNRHRITFSENRNYINSDPDTTNTRQRTFPGFPAHGAQLSTRYQITTTLRSTFSNNLINELRVGGSGGPTQFSPGLEPSMWNGSLANQGGYKLTLRFGLTNPDNSSSMSQRRPTTRIFEDTLTWLKGSHSMSMGFSRAFRHLGREHERGAGHRL